MARLISSFSQEALGQEEMCVVALETEHRDEGIWEDKRYGGA